MKMDAACLLVASVAFTVGVPPTLAQETGVVAPHHVMAGGYYVREATDQEWHLRFVGEIPSLCGAYVVVHNAANRIIYQGPIPHAKYPAEKPYVIAIKPDGITGDYRIIILGHQNDMLGVVVPCSDLPQEVYGGGSLSIGHEPNAKVYFKAPEGITRMNIGAHVGQFKVLDSNDNVAADSKVSGKRVKEKNLVEFDVVPGATYRLVLQTFYFGSPVPDTFYITFDPARWFKPVSELNKVQWWRTVK